MAGIATQNHARASAPASRRVNVPAGAKELRLKVERLATPVFVGYAEPSAADIYIRHHADGAAYPIPKADIMPEECALRRRVEALAESRGVSYADALDELERMFLSGAPDTVVIPANQTA